MKYEIQEYVIHSPDFLNAWREAGLPELVSRWEHRKYYNSKRSAIDGLKRLRRKAKAQTLPKIKYRLRAIKGV